MNCFCGMVDQRKVNLISSLDHCQRPSPSKISDTPEAGFAPAQNLSSGLVEWSCAVVTITTPSIYHYLHYHYNQLFKMFLWNPFWEFSDFLHNDSVLVTLKRNRAWLFEQILFWGFGAKRAKNVPKMKFF